MGMKKTMVDTKNSTGWTSGGVVLTPEQVGKVVRGEREGTLVLVPTVKANVFEVHPKI